MKNLLVAILCCCVFQVFGQKKYFVTFTDKSESPYQVDKPEKFLSQRAIERRQRQGIQITEQDLPVNPRYVKALQNGNTKVYSTTKWFNGATIYTKEEELDKIKALPFVKNVEYTGKEYKKKIDLRKNKTRDSKTDYPKIKNEYGYGWNQIAMLNGHLIHQMGYKGEGVMVAVLDGGFTNVDIMPFFDSLRANNRLLVGTDIVDKDDWMYESSSHGTKVLSTMAANLPYFFIGTGPEATYMCIKTEDVRSEFRIEEDNWVVGAEYADSAGVDVINSSLGYTTFNDASMNHTYEKMNGNTSRATIAADIAVSKGMIIVNSAGNEGGGAWKYVGAPADGDSVLAIGAVDRFGKRAYFSSQGPTYDGRVKPNIMARGEKTVVASLYGYQIDSANGTSFASPVMAGMIASLWQAFPNKTSMEIITAVQMAGDNYDKPNGKYGHGIPDFYKAFQLLSGYKEVALGSKRENTLAVSQLVNGVNLKTNGGKDGEIVKLRIFDLFGNTIYSVDLKGDTFAVKLDENLDKSKFYLLSLGTEKNIELYRVINQ